MGTLITWPLQYLPRLDRVLQGPLQAQDDTGRIRVIQCPAYLRARKLILRNAREQATATPHRIDDRRPAQHHEARALASPSQLLP
jgi:hypothetical protein